jgi:glycosyltransferase involved in cell wall biosynthesis
LAIRGLAVGGVRDLEETGSEIPAMQVVSVLMPVYNAERYVAEAIESILAQTFNDFELIIVDDGSTDQSLSILRRYSEQDARIRSTSSPHRGICATRNAALAMSRGEFIAVLDSDDVASPDRFEKQVGFLRTHPECVAVGCGAEVIDAEGALIGRWFMPPSHNEIDQTHLHVGMAMIHSALMARRLAVNRVGGYHLESESCEDLDLFLRLADVGQLVNLEEPLIKYRKHTMSNTHQKRNLLGNISKAAVNAARRRRNLNELPPTYKVRGTGAREASDYHRSWAWGALKIGNTPTARKHALRAFRCNPFHVESWRVVYCVLRSQLRSSNRPPRHQVDPPAKRSGGARR